MCFLCVFKFNFLDWKITQRSSGSSSAAFRAPEPWEGQASRSDTELPRAFNGKTAKKRLLGFKIVQEVFRLTSKKWSLDLGHSLKGKEGLERAFMRQLWLLGATMTAALSGCRKG